MATQRRPKGDLWSIDQAWKDEVEKAMDAKDVSRAQLARDIGVTASAITVLFRPETKQTRLVPAIAKALGMALPDKTPPTVSAVSKDDAFRRMQKVWSTLTDEQREHLIATGELLGKSR